MFGGLYLEAAAYFAYKTYNSFSRALELHA